MNENDLDPERAAHAPLDDEAIERLLGQAGKRSPIPRDDLEAIAGTARDAWHAREREGQSRLGSASVAAPRTVTLRRRQSHAIVALALAAGLSALLFGTRAWWRANETGSPAVTTTAPARVALVEVSSTSLRVEEDGVERTVAAGQAINAGAIVHGASAETRAAGAQPVGAALRLESGAAIRLDAGAAARLVSPARIDLLAGTIYADTAPDATRGAASHHPTVGLEIHTPAGVVRDIGTRFMARLVVGQPTTMHVLVRDGRVAVERDSDSKIAGAGEQIIARAGAAIEVATAPTWGSDWQWVIDAAPPFEVAGRSMAEILDWVARETGWTVRYEDAALAEAARGMIQQSSREQTTMRRPDQAPFVLLPNANLEGKVEAGILTVRRQRAP